MRCCGVIFLVQFCTLSAVYSKTNWENELVLDIFNSKPNTSMVVAVLPLRLAFCKILSIAEGRTKEQLLKALSDEKDTKTDTCYSSISVELSKIKEREMILLNKIYLNYSGEMDTNFVTNSSSSYGVNVDFVGFNKPKAALSFINNGIASATYRRIRSIIKMKDITDQTKMIMITAAHLKATWEEPFDVNVTKHRKFFHLNDKVSDVLMMSQASHYQVFEGNTYQVLSLMLQSAGAMFTLIVPNQPKGLLGLLDDMRINPNLLKEAKAGMKIQMRTVVMPRLKIKSYLDLTDILKNSTVNETLNSNTTDLNKILKEEFRSSSNMFVNKVKQSLFLEVDELGVARREISPEDRFLYEPRRERMSPREFAADRPFLFTFDLNEFIPNDEGVTFLPHQLFSGVYYGPE